MKKTYTKPALYAESFELAEHIASCSVVNRDENYYGTHSSGTASCVFHANNQILFNGSHTGCLEDWSMTMPVECYNTPNGTPGLPFAS